jgi:hypothetical protein
MLLGLAACQDPASIASPSDDPVATAPGISLSLSSSPGFSGATFFGGSGDQFGTAIALNGSGVHAAGYDGAAGGILLQYSDPPGTLPTWDVTLPGTFFTALALHPAKAYPIGFANPPACGATDGAGDTEGKTMLAQYTTAGVFIGCASHNWFPYRGGEFWQGGLGTVESGTPFEYATGWAEQTGFSFSFPFMLAKYDADGTLVGAVTEPGITLGTFGCCPGSSLGFGLAEYNGHIYVAGFSRLFGFGEDNVERPVLMKYTPALGRVWKMRPADNPGGYFRAVTSVGGYLVVVGQAGFGAGADYLIEKYDETGARLWSVTSGGATEDILTGVMAVGARLFAVGYTASSGAGGIDAVMLEIDPATGATLNTTLYGGANDDKATGVATNGDALFVVGESRSFASVEGNVVGQNDIMLLTYGLVRTVAIDVIPGGINLTARGVIPVAILTDPGFDAALVDVATVRFGATGTEAPATQPSLEDVDGDGDIDLKVLFRTQETGLGCASTSAKLTGQTTGGQEIQGSDVIHVVKC